MLSVFHSDPDPNAFQIIGYIHESLSEKKKDIDHSFVHVYSTTSILSRGIDGWQYGNAMLRIL